MSTLGPGGAEWDDIYAGDGSDTEPFDARLLADALILEPGRCLDLGCGGGGNLIGLAQRGWRASGVDSSRRAIRSARISAARAGVSVRLYRDDITTWQPDGVYDLVISLFALPPPGPARSGVLDMARSALAPGGLLVVAEWEATDTHPQGYVSVGELVTALQGLRVLRAVSVDADPDLSSREPARDWRAAWVTARKVG